MKSLICILTLAFAAMLFADETGSNASTQRATSQSARHRAQLAKKRNRLFLQQSGGIIEKEYEGNVFRVLSAQRDFTGEKLAKLNLDLRYSATLPIECVPDADLRGKSPVDAAEELVATKGVGAGALIVEDEKLPIFLFSPDHRWGILNITPVKADKPDAALFERRIAKLYWMLVARTLGAGISSYPNCVLVPFSSMRELDSILATKPCPEPFNKMVETGKAYGIGTLTITSYRRACQEGWAPAPTNDIQKAIWDKVHTIPAAPMKIEFDPKKGR